MGECKLSFFLFFFFSRSGSRKVKNSNTLLCWETEPNHCPPEMLSEAFSVAYNLNSGQAPQ